MAKAVRARRAHSRAVTRLGPRPAKKFLVTVQRPCYYPRFRKFFSKQLSRGASRHF